MFSAADVGSVLRCLSSGCINLDFIPCYTGLWFLSSCYSGLSLHLRPDIQTIHPHSCPGALLVSDSCTWGTPPSSALCVSSLQPTSRETSVSPSLSGVTLLGALVNTVSVMCVWLVLAVFFLQSGTSLRAEVMASFAHTPVPVGLGV